MHFNICTGFSAWAVNALFLFSNLPNLFEGDTYLRTNLLKIFETQRILSPKNYICLEFVLLISTMFNKCICINYIKRTKPVFSISSKSPSNRLFDNILITNMIPLFAGVFSIIPELIEHAAWSIGVGILIVALFVSFLILIIRGCYPRSTFSPISVIVTGILSILLCFQSVPLCAAIGLKWHLDDMRDWINETVIQPENYLISEPISPEESTQIVDEAVKNYPLMGIMFDGGWFEGYNTFNIAEGIANEASRCLNDYILQKLLVAFVETAIGAFVIVKTIDRAVTNKRNRRRQIAGRQTVGRRKVSSVRRQI